MQSHLTEMNNSPNASHFSINMTSSHVIAYRNHYLIAVIALYSELHYRICEMNFVEAASLCCAEIIPIHVQERCLPYQEMVEWNAVNIIYDSLWCERREWK